MFSKTLFIFRRDLRLEDNTGLIFALKHSKEVIASFIFTKEQIEAHPYRSLPALRFMMDSLEELKEELKGHLYFFSGHPEDVVEECIQKLHIDAVMFNRDYTPYSLKRDQKIEAVCKKRAVACKSFEDALLHPLEETLKADGKPYTIFTPFYKNAQKNTVRAPEKNRHTNYFKSKIPFAKLPSLPTLPSVIKGGRKEGLLLLKKAKTLSHYKTQRDLLSENATTHLSPHLKFTTLSPREVFAALCDANLIRSLYWRDFFTQIAFHFPHVFKGAFHPAFDALKWEDNPTHFKKWCEGKTGFPLVDAGMRELNTTGSMHNRARMVVASFLVKDLHIDWRLGERYFAKHLVDYDPAINNGNWQWAASTGCDAQPYFRIFNPWTQQQRFDPDCLYIKKWLPELEGKTPKEIHSQLCHPLPIVDHPIESKKALASYKSAASRHL